MGSVSSRSQTTVKQALMLNHLIKDGGKLKPLEVSPRVSIPTSKYSSNITSIRSKEELN